MRSSPVFLLLLLSLFSLISLLPAREAEMTSDQARFLRLFTNLLSRGNSDLNEDKILIGRLFTSLEQLRTDRRTGTVEARTSPSQALRGGEKNKHQQEQNAIHDHWASSQHSHQHTEETEGRGEHEETHNHSHTHTHYHDHNHVRKSSENHKHLREFFLSGWK